MAPRTTDQVNPADKEAVCTSGMEMSGRRGARGRNRGQAEAEQDEQEQEEQEQERQEEEEQQE